MDIINQFISQHIIWFNTKEELYGINCDAHLSFDFQFEDNQVYSLNETDLIVKSTNQNECIALIGALDPVPYSDIADWHLGTVFSRRYCQAFNFVDKTMSLSEYKT